MYDYADLNVPMLARMFDRRCAGYEAVGYTVLIPGSAVPGWPAEVLLPVDPLWKSEYAASVRRLIRDGVDAQFGEITCGCRSEAGSRRHGRGSSTQRHRGIFLSTIGDTAGTGRPFPTECRTADLLRRMGKHGSGSVVRGGAVGRGTGRRPASGKPWDRRDRRKDALLQEHGYFVLRFLAEDVGAKLDMVLDALLRALTHRRVSAERR